MSKKIYTQWSPKPRNPVKSQNPGPGARQEFKKDCDLNTLLRKYKNDASLLMQQMKPKQFADVTNIPDFVEIQDRISAATDFFMSLPAIVRFELGNDVANLVQSSPEQISALLKKHGTKYSLDVIGPTDTNQSVVSKKLTQKEIDDVQESYVSPSEQKKLQKRKSDQQAQPQDQ